MRPALALFFSPILFLLFQSQAQAAIILPRDCDLHLKLGYSYRPSVTPRPIESFKRFRVVTFNFENYVIDKNGPHGRELKPLKDIEKVAAVAQLADGEVLVAQEVASFEAASRFARNFLSNKYQVYFFPATMKYSLGIAIFIKRDLPFFGTFYSHKHHEWDPTGYDPVPVHIRDIPTVVFRRTGRESSKIVISAVHLKAKNFGNKAGESVTDLQEAQAESLGLIAGSFDEPSNPKMLNLNIGDFNLRRDSEFLRPFLRSGDFRSTFDLNPEGPPKKPIATQAYVKSEDGQVFEQQVDAIFMNENAAGRLKRVGVIFGKDRNGEWITNPLEVTDLEAMGTDHGLVYSDFDIRDF
jgi:hypothetical protein